MRKYAILIGINQYEDPGIRPLECAETDAHRMAALLRDSCGFEAAIPLVGASAHSGKIVESIESVADKMRTDDLFVFFFAGHGIEHDERGHLLLLQGARRSVLKHMPQEVLAVRDLEKLFRSLSCQQHLLLLDACRGSLDSTRGGVAELATPPTTRDIGVLKDSYGVKDCRIICSCSPGEQAHELPEIGAGAFSEGFIRAVRSRVVDRREVAIDAGFLTDVQSHISEAVSTARPGARQQPWIQGGIRPLVLLQSEVGRRAAVSSPSPRTPPPLPSSNPELAAPSEESISDSKSPPAEIEKQASGIWPYLTTFPRLRRLTGRLYVWAATVSLFLVPFFFHDSGEAVGLAAVVMVVPMCSVLGAFWGLVAELCAFILQFFYRTVDTEKSFGKKILFHATGGCWIGILHFLLGEPVNGFLLMLMGAFIGGLSSLLVDWLPQRKKKKT